MPTKKFDPDKRYDLTLQHGSSTKVLKGAAVRSFKQDGENRWEATGMHPNIAPYSDEEYEEEQTVGFLPEMVVQAEEV